MPSYDAPYRWSVHLYGLIEEGERPNEQLAVCVRHQGAHPWYLDACHAIQKGLGKRERVAIYARSLERQPDPQLLEMEARYAGDGAMPPEHLHPLQAERFTVREGAMRTIVVPADTTWPGSASTAVTMPDTSATSVV